MHVINLVSSATAITIAFSAHRVGFEFEGNSQLAACSMTRAKIASGPRRQQGGLPRHPPDTTAFFPTSGPQQSFP